MKLLSFGCFLVLALIQECDARKLGLFRIRTAEGSVGQPAKNGTTGSGNHPFRLEDVHHANFQRFLYTYHSLSMSLSMSMELSFSMSMSFSMNSDFCPNRVIGFNLWNANTNSFYKPLQNGATICQEQFKFNIEVVVLQGGPLGSVVVDGSCLGYYYLNGSPFFVFSDWHEQRNGRWIPAGNYRIKATPYSKSMGFGTTGQSLEITFEVVECNRELQKVEGNDSDGDDDSQNDTVDFIIAGFPKTGTTSLLQAFATHPETLVAPHERCDIVSVGKADFIQSLNTTGNETKRGVKCPSAMYSYKTITHMVQQSPQAKIIVGVRHPVSMLESFYNYRVTEIYERQQSEAIPSFEGVMRARKPWKGVSINSTRYDLFLMQLDKTTISEEEMKDVLDMKAYPLFIQPNRFQVFLYSLEQMEDTFAAREISRELEKFMGLSTPLEPISHENKNHFVGASGFPETVDICHHKYEMIRNSLIQGGAQSAKWIQEKFLLAPDVVVAGKETFHLHLNDWSKDPCGADAVE